MPADFKEKLEAGLRAGTLVEKVAQENGRDTMNFFRWLHSKRLNA